MADEDIEEFNDEEDGRQSNRPFILAVIALLLSLVICVAATLAIRVSRGNQNDEVIANQMATATAIVATNQAVEAINLGVTKTIEWRQTEDARPTNTLQPTNTPVPTNTPIPTSTPAPTETPVVNEANSEGNGSDGSGSGSSDSGSTDSNSGDGSATDGSSSESSGNDGSSSSGGSDSASDSGSASGSGSGSAESGSGNGFATPTPDFSGNSSLPQTGIDAWGAFIMGLAFIVALIVVRQLRATLS